MDELFRIVEYTGTLESLEEMVKNLNLEQDDYNFDVKRKTMIVRKGGFSIIYKPGYHYTYRIEEEFKAIG